MNIPEAITLYKKVGHRNADFLFNWLHDVYLNLYLPCIDNNLKDTLAKDKTLLTIFDVLIDDLADNYNFRNESLLDEFIQIPWSQAQTSTNDYLETAHQIWNSAIASIQTYPRYKEFKRLFYFDLRQVLSSMEYSLLVNTMRIDNKLEDRTYLPHGCMVILHSDMDLMCSPDFNLKELNHMRTLFHLAQEICHIGNMLSTYPREIQEKDFSSPIISLAIRKCLLKRDEIPDEKVLKNLEDFYKNKAENLFHQILTLKTKVKSLDIETFHNKYKQVYNLFLERGKYWATK